MWLRATLAVVLVALVSAEKLGNIEVITRGELGHQGLVPPDKEHRHIIPENQDHLQQPQLHSQQGQTGFVKTSELTPKIVFPDNPPPPAISYLPPVKTPLPIESTPAPQQTELGKPDVDYLPPVETPTVVNPVGIYTPPDGQHDGDHSVPVIVDVGNVDGGDHKEGGYVEVPVPVPVPVHVPVKPIPAPATHGDTFFSGIKDSKLSVLGGLVGAKAAIFDGFKTAKETLASGIAGAIAAKGAAISSLRPKSHYGGHYEAVGRPVVVNNNGPDGGLVGSGGEAGGVITGGGYPVAPKPIVPNPPIAPEPVPAPLPAPAPAPVPYPVYPPYPEPVYPVKPVYWPKPTLFGGLKAKLGGIVQAKKDVVADVIAKVSAAKENLRQKVAGVFHKGPTYVPTYHAYPTYPVYPTAPTHHTYPAYPPAQTEFTGYKPQVFNKPIPVFYGPGYHW